MQNFKDKIHVIMIRFIFKVGKILRDCNMSTLVDFDDLDGVWCCSIESEIPAGTKMKKLYFLVFAIKEEVALPTLCFRWKF